MQVSFSGKGERFQHVKVASSGLSLESPVPNFVELVDNVITGELSPCLSFSSLLLLLKEGALL